MEAMAKARGGTIYAPGRLGDRASPRSLRLAPCRLVIEPEPASFAREVAVSRSVLAQRFTELVATGSSRRGIVPAEFVNTSTPDPRDRREGVERGRGLFGGPRRAET
jgi:hypothetical protein